jgi:predicted negative regulator of RcsB-dependent stress response
LTSERRCDGILLVTKKKVKEELKKPDIVLLAIERVTGWVKQHARLCIIGLVVLAVIAVAITGVRIYQARVDEEMQYRLAEGIKAFQEYASGGKEDSLKKAESIFKGLSTSGRNGIEEIALLYLGKIYYLQGKNEDAKAQYQKVKGRAGSSVIVSLAESGLKNSEPPAK